MKQQQDRPDDLTGRSNDRQGVDKAPGEETPSGVQNVVNETQKGKNKVDGDPDKPSDQPISDQNA